MRWTNETLTELLTEHDAKTAARIMGVKYPSIIQAARYHGVDIRALNRRRRDRAVGVATALRTRDTLAKMIAGVKADMREIMAVPIPANIRPFKGPPSA